MPRRKVLSELQRAEVRYRDFLEKRDGLNAEARAFREERDLLNGKKGEVREALRAVYQIHDGIVAEVQAHKARRNELQGRAKELLALKRTLRGRLQGGVEAGLQRLRERVARMEREQETRPLALEEENRLLEELRQARAELVELEGLRQEHAAVLERVGELDEAVDDLFRRADAEHEALVAKSRRVDELRRQMDEKRGTLRVLDAESDRLHAAFGAARERADHYHARAAEMREKVISIREARRAEDREAQAYVEAQRETVRDALEDDTRWEEAVEEALDHLRKGGKLEL